MNFTETNTKCSMLYLYKFQLQDLLAKICFELGDTMDSLVHIRRVIETVKHRYGEDSIELGNELVKMVGVAEALVDEESS